MLILHTYTHAASRSTSSPRVFLLFVRSRSSAGPPTCLAIRASSRILPLSPLISTSSPSFLSRRSPTSSRHSMSKRRLFTRRLTTPPSVSVHFYLQPGDPRTPAHIHVICLTDQSWTCSSRARWQSSLQLPRSLSRPLILVFASQISEATCPKRPQREWTGCTSA